MLVKKLKNILENILLENDTKKIDHISEFQNLVWNDDTINDKILNDLLTSIAYDLDFYQPNQIKRKESNSYYDNVDLHNLIKKSLIEMEKITNNNKN
ncbi:MAG: hypothetical protein HWD85_06390 [Flavobacteriaceae bacterium]|nr:hypothetical protein [Flavobacteriaceae bacterium]